MTTSNGHPRRLATTIVVALASLLLLALPAHAQYPVPSDNGLSCTPENPTPGQQVTCVSGGYQPNSIANWRVIGCDDEIVAQGTATADANGTVSFTYTVPADSDCDTYSAVLSGTNSNGEPVTATDTFTVSGSTGGGDGDGDDLPATGADSAPIALIAGGAVVAGGLLVLVARRRREDVAA